MSKKDIELLRTLIEKPGMFSINKIEDFSLFLLGYSYTGDSTLFFFMNEEFSKFLTESFNDGVNVSWDRHIRMYSSNDIHSLRLFKDKLDIFLKEKKY